MYSHTNPDRNFSLFTNENEYNVGYQYKVSKKIPEVGEVILFDVKVINPKNESLNITLYLKQILDLNFQANLEEIILDLDQPEGYTTCGEKIWPYLNGYCCEDGSVSINQESCGLPKPIQLNIEPFSNTTVSFIYTTITPPSQGFETGEPAIIGIDVSFDQEIKIVKPEDYGLSYSLNSQQQLPPGAVPISGPGWFGVQIGNKIGIIINGKMVFFEKDPADGNLYKLDPVTEERELDGQGNPIILDPNNLQRLPPPPQQKQRPEGILLGKKGKEGRRAVCGLEDNIQESLEDVNQKYNNCLENGGSPNLTVTVSQPNLPEDKVLDNKKVQIIIDAAKKQAGDKKDVFYKVLKSKLLNILRGSKDPQAELYIEVDCGAQPQRIKIMEDISSIGNCACDQYYFSSQGLVARCLEDC